MRRCNSTIVRDVPGCGLGRVRLAWAAVPPAWLLAAIAGCSPASFVPALTFGASAIVHERTPPGANPLAVRAGAWMTWRAKTTSAAPVPEMTVDATGASDARTDDAAAEPACAIAAACTWAVAAREDALGRVEQRHALEAQEKPR